VGVGVQGSGFIGHWWGANIFEMFWRRGVLVLLEVGGWVGVVATNKLGEALIMFGLLALVSGSFNGLQVVVGMLKLARRGGCDSRVGREVWDEEVVPYEHCNLREKAGKIFENSCKS
jgi:hypothetical protein